MVIKKQNNNKNKQMKNHPNQTKQTENPNTKTANRREGGEYNFQSYHIIRFKYLVFNNDNKNHEASMQRNRKV